MNNVWMVVRWIIDIALALVAGWALDLRWSASFGVWVVIQLTHLLHWGFKKFLEWNAYENEDREPAIRILFGEMVRLGYPYPHPNTSARSYFQQVVEDKDLPVDTRIDAMSILSNILRYEYPSPFYEGLRYTIILEAGMCDLVSTVKTIDPS